MQLFIGALIALVAVFYSVGMYLITHTKGDRNKMAAYLGYPVGKLVRDRIPEIIERDENRPVTKKLRGSYHYFALIEKLKEETLEVKRAETRTELLEELADVIEVCHALAAKVGYGLDELEIARTNKLAERGGFYDGVYLREVHINPKHAKGAN